MVSDPVVPCGDWTDSGNRVADRTAVLGRGTGLSADCADPDPDCLDPFEQ